MDPASIASICVAVVAALASLAANRTARANTTLSVQADAYERARKMDLETIARLEEENEEMREENKKLEREVRHLKLRVSRLELYGYGPRVGDIVKDDFNDQ